MSKPVTLSAEDFLFLLRIAAKQASKARKAVADADEAAVIFAHQALELGIPLPSVRQALAAEGVPDLMTDYAGQFTPVEPTTKVIQ